MNLSVTTLASRLDHTLLKPDATAKQITTLCDEARYYGVAAVCVNSSRVKQAVHELARTSVAVCTVIGFPFGASLTASKVAEVHFAREAGATEFDMVIDIGALKDGRLEAVSADIRAVRQEALGLILKVIIEAAALTPRELVEVCHIAEGEGANFVKTSTGYHPAGGATVDAVAAMRAAVAPGTRVKASGGIRDLAVAKAMLAAGADRLGLSATSSILNELAPQPS